MSLKAKGKNKRLVQKRIWIGIDNGVSGSIGWVGEEEGLIPTPTFSKLNYQKTKAKNITRINTIVLKQKLTQLTFGRRAKVFLERPMVNPKRFQGSASALRALEATLIVLESLNLSFEYCDSKGWQKELLPPVKGAPALKKASLQIGLQMFPQLNEPIEKQGDADGILIAEWARRL